MMVSARWPVSCACICVAAALVLVGSRAIADPMPIRGAGTSVCATLNKQSKNGETVDLFENITTTMMFGWIQGYISGVNVANAAKAQDY